MMAPVNMVRKHRAPKGALRLEHTPRDAQEHAGVRKHRAPKGALRPRESIELLLQCHLVRKHRAPKGALRQGKRPTCEVPEHVRKHRAPKGALRPIRVVAGAIGREIQSQKAPSAKRCIKTRVTTVVLVILPQSESTERQKVH